MSGYLQKFDAIGDLTLVFQMILLDPGTGDARLARRSIDLVIDGTPHRIDFLAPSTSQLEESFSCRQVNSSEILGPMLDVSGTTGVTQNQLVMTLIIKLIPSSSPSFRLNEARSNVVLSGIEGSVRFQGAVPATLYTLGDIQRMSIQGNVTSARFDNREAVVTSTDTYVLVGRFSARLESGNQLLVEGTGDAVMRNGARQNQTRWESLDIGWKLSAVAFLASILVGATRSAYLVLKGNMRQRPIDWYMGPSRASTEVEQAP